MLHTKYSGLSNTELVRVADSGEVNAELVAEMAERLITRRSFSETLGSARNQTGEVETARANLRNMRVLKGD